MLVGFSFYPTPGATLGAHILTSFSNALISPCYSIPFYWYWQIPWDPRFCAPFLSNSPSGRGFFLFFDAGDDRFASWIRRFLVILARSMPWSQPPSAKHCFVVGCGVDCICEPHTGVCCVLIWKWIQTQHPHVLAECQLDKIRQFLGEEFSSRQG